MGLNKRDDDQDNEEDDWAEVAQRIFKEFMGIKNVIEKIFKFMID